MIKIDWHTVRASTHTRNTYWRPPREGEQPEASPRWMRQVCRKKKKKAATINSFHSTHKRMCRYLCVCVCVRSVLVPVTHSNSVSSLKTTQALLAMPPSLPPPQSGVEINIYHIRGKRGRRTNGEAERAKQREDGDAGGYDDNGFPLGRGQKLMEKWSYLKKQTNKRVERVVQHENSSKQKKKKKPRNEPRGGERHPGRFMVSSPHWILGRRSVFLCLAFTTLRSMSRSARLLLRVQTRNPKPFKEASLTPTAIFNMKESGMYIYIWNWRVHRSDAEGYCECGAFVGEKSI